MAVTGVVALLVFRGKVNRAQEAAAAAAAADAGAANDGGASAGGDPAPHNAAGCQGVKLTTEPTKNGTAERVHWWDASCHERTALMIPADVPDESGRGGGYVRELTYQQDGSTKLVKGTDINAWRGFGYVITHFYDVKNGRYDDAETLDPRIKGSQTVAFRGTNHLLYEYKWHLDPGGPVDATAQWFFATGRDHPLFTITYDARPAGADVVRADARAPYGEMAFEGDGTRGTIGGVSWGDRYRFTTTSSGPLTMQSSWDYRETNEIPFDRMWSATVDAEMGLVGTARWVDKPQGGDYAPDVLHPLWGTAGKGLPIDFAWPYQINQYELPFGTDQHRLAWGMTFGAVGSSIYEAWGKTLSGFPFQSYAVRVVVGKHAGNASAVMQAVSDAEAEVGTEVTAMHGRIAGNAAGGPGRSDAVEIVNGWDTAYGVWSIEGDGRSGASFKLKVPAGKELHAPMVRIHNWTSSTVRRLKVGKETILGDEILTSYDGVGRTLWLTIPRNLRGENDISAEP